MNSISLINFRGWSPECKNNREKISEMKKVIERPEINSVAISGHSSPDGDSIGATYAMAYLLKHKLNKPVDVYIPGGLPKKFESLRDQNINLIEERNNESIPHYDLAVSLDTSDNTLIDNWYYNNIFSKADNTLKIDHHESGKEYADINLSDGNASCASEMVMQFVEPLGINPKEMPQKFNEAIYTGIVTDTGRFAHVKNSLPFKDAELLIKNGLDINKVLNNDNEKIPKEVNNVIMMAHKRLAINEDGNVGYLYLDHEMRSAIDKLSNQDNKRDAISYMKYMAHSLKNVEGVKVTLFINQDRKNLRISARSNDVDVMTIAQKHGGGGHTNAAAFTIPKNNEARTTTENVINEYSEYIKSHEK